MSLRLPALPATRLAIALFAAGVGLLFAAAGARAGTLTPSGPIVINGKSGTVISGVHVTSTSGDCVQIINSTKVTIQNSEIGPCGTNNSTANSRGVYISNGSSINVYDSYIHVENLASVCGQSHDGIYVENSRGPIQIQGNVIAYNERNVRLEASSNASVIGNYLLNPRGASSCRNAANLGGDQVQSWADAPTTNLTISNNYTHSDNADNTGHKYPGHVSDSINFGFVNGVTVNANYVDGGWFKSGCGIIADDAVNNARITNNNVGNTFNCGIGVASGKNHTVSGNKVLILQPSTPYAAGIVVEGSDYSPAPCNTISITGNSSYAIQSGGYVQSYYNDGYCSSVTLTSNTWGQAAYNKLYPLSSTNPPPRIPPKPFNCVARSPYSNNEAVSACPGAP